MSGSDLLCGHWTFFTLGDEEAVARCDLSHGHPGVVHTFWWSPGTNETFSWAESSERHTPRERKENTSA